MNYSKKVNDYVFPLIATNIAQLLINQLSLHFAVNNSNIALSSISIIQNFLFAFGGILGAFSLGFNIKGARAHGNGEKERFQDLLKSSLLLDFIIGFIFLVICLLFGEFFLRYFYGFDGELLKVSVIYLKIMSPYILLTLLTFLLTNILKVEKKTKPIFGIGVASSALDVAFNYYLVPVFGIQGAAFSAILSLLIIVISYFMLVYPIIFDALLKESTTKKELFKFGLPLTGQEILESVLFIMVFDALMGRQGIGILSIYAVISQLFSIVRTPAFMYSGAVSIFLPEAQKKNEVKNLLSTIYKNVYLTSIIFTVVIVLGSNVFAQFLSDKIYQNIMPMTLYTMMIMGATPLYESSKMTLQSLDDEKWVLKITSLINVLSVLVLLVIQLLGIQTYYTLYFVYGLSLLILSYSFIKRRQSRDNL